MSRHRNIRSMNYSDEYDGYDDVYGHSVDDETCISPTDAQQWLYDRARGQQSISSFIATHRDIDEEEEDEDEDAAAQRHAKLRRDSENFQMPTLNDEDQACLTSCMDEIRNVVGESVSERQLVDTIMKFKFDFAKSLDAILNASTTPPTKSTRLPAVTTSIAPTIETDLNPTSLNDLLKQRGQLGAPNGVAKKFAIPNLFNRPAAISAATTAGDKCNGAPESGQPPTFNTLTDLANFRLKNSGVNGIVSSNITIPKMSTLPNMVLAQSPLGAQSGSADRLTPHEISLKKIMEMRKLNISDDSKACGVAVSATLATATMAATMPQPLLIHSPSNSPLVNSTKFVVDLSSALLTKSDTVTTPIRIIPEVFDVQFVDCELPAASALAPVITKDCEIDASAILTVRLDNRTHKSSPLGKILCSRFRCKRMPYVSHEFEPKHHIIPFAFNVPNKLRKINVKRCDIQY